MANKVIVNHALIDRVRKARELMPELNPSKEVLERWNILQLGDQCEGFTEADFATVIVYALHNCPHVVMKTILDELEGKNNHERKTDTYNGNDQRPQGNTDGAPVSRQGTV